MSAEALQLYLSGRLAGEVRRGPHGGIILGYEPSWVQDPLAYPLSLSLPLDGQRFKAQRVENTLAGLLPESREILEDWRRRYRIKDVHDPLQVLAAVGMDVAGSAQFTDDPGSVTGRGSSLEEVSEAELAEMIRESREYAGAMPLLEEVPRVSLAGQQSKFALAKVEGRWHIPRGNAPSTHIFKPAPPRLRDVDVVELVVMRAAAAVGLRVASSSVERIGGEPVFISERYDRVPTTGGGVARIHQEDLVQALGVPVAKKYQRDGGAISLPRIIGLLRQHAAAEDVDEFIMSRSVWRTGRSSPGTRISMSTGCWAWSPGSGIGSPTPWRHPWPRWARRRLSASPSWRSSRPCPDGPEFSHPEPAEVGAESMRAAGPEVLEALGSQ